MTACELRTYLYERQFGTGFKKGHHFQARLVSSRHLAFIASEQMHSELRELLAQLHSGKVSLTKPVEPSAIFMSYHVSDERAANDLVKVLPELLKKNWSPQGSIHQTVDELFIEQPASVHHQLNLLMTALQASYERWHPETKRNETSGVRDDIITSPELDEVPE